MLKFKKSHTKKRFVNLGCGTKVHEDWLNIDKSISLIIAKRKFLKKLLVLTGFLKGGRLKKIDKLPESIVVYDLSKGVPYEDNTFEMVYSSHVLEHIDKQFSFDFMRECHRVLKPNGILRIVVPDLELLVKNYLNSFSADIGEHETATSDLLEQMVRKEASGTSKQAKTLRKVENFFLGDARKRGETHQWMYDRVSLPNLFLTSGFKEIKIMSFNTSKLESWNNFGLDCNKDGLEYKTGSLYVEGIK